MCFYCILQTRSHCFLGECNKCDKTGRSQCIGLLIATQSHVEVFPLFVGVFQIFQEHPLQNCYHGNNTVSPSLCNYTAAAEDPGKVVGEPNTALLSFVLMAGTYFIAFYLRKFKNSSFFPGRVSTYEYMYEYMQL